MTTTSRLSVCAGDLTEMDLQVLADFAHDPTTPWEWRKALEALIDKVRESDEIEEKYEDLKAAVSNAIEEIEGISDGLKDREMSVTDAYRKLEEELVELKKAVNS